MTSELVPTTSVDLLIAECRRAGPAMVGARGSGGFPGLLTGSVAVA